MRIAFLFPGQGSQYIGMGKELCESFHPARIAYEEASDALGMDISRLCFEGPEEKLLLTENTQPAILGTSIAALRVINEETGIAPAVVAGHSVGEYSALVAAGAMAFTDAIKTVRLRGRFMQEAVPEGEGSMAALLGIDKEAAEKICGEVQGKTEKVVELANLNSPKQVVISGHSEAIEAAMELARKNGAKKAVKLNVSAPFHSSLIKPAGERLKEVLMDIKFETPLYPIIANVDAELNSDKNKLVDLLTRQVSSPVKWEDSMRRLREIEIEFALEVGPGRVLSSLLRWIDREIKTSNVEDVASLKKLTELQT